MCCELSEEARPAGADHAKAMQQGVWIPVDAESLRLTTSFQSPEQFRRGDWNAGILIDRYPAGSDRWIESACLGADQRASGDDAHRRRVRGRGRGRESGSDLPISDCGPARTYGYGRRGHEDHEREAISGWRMPAEGSGMP